MKTLVLILSCYGVILFASKINSGYNAFVFINGSTPGLEIAAGITTAGNASYNIQALVRTYNATANHPNSGAKGPVAGNSMSAANNLIINNSAGVELYRNIKVCGILSFISGNIDCSTNSHSVTNNAVGAIARTSGHVIGNLQRAVANATNTYNYPVGTATGYTPASIAFSSVGTGGNLIVKSSDATYEQHFSALNAWLLT